MSTAVRVCTNPFFIAMSNVRNRSFVFTWNNYPAEYADTLASLGQRYIVYGREVAPTSGTPHLQGYLYFSNARTVRSVRRKLVGAHVECARGTFLQNRTYCTKSGDYHEDGNPPTDDSERGAAEIRRWDAAWDSAKLGDLDSIPADIKLRYYSTIKRIGEDFMSRAPSLPGVCGKWVHGESGAGKTRAVLAAYPEAYIKPRNNWWDGYQHEKVVLVDDVDKFDRALGGKLKHWADFCPFIAERKGGSMRIRPEKVFVTSQYKIEDIWEDEETREALGRRFVVIEKQVEQNIII